MPLTYNQLADLRRDQSFLDKLIIAIGFEANTILLEDPSTTLHIPRMLWAQRVFSGPTGADQMAQQMIMRIIQDSTIQTYGTSSTDGTVQTVLTSIINDYVARGI